MWRRSLAAVAVALVLLGGCDSVAPPGRTGPSPSASSAIPSVTNGADRPDHVVVVIFENKSDQQLTAAAAPWLNETASRAAVFPNATAVAHPSQPNYLALFSGSTHGITDNRCDFDLIGKPNLGRQLLDAGLTFAAYSEDLPSVGWSGCSSGGYVAKHAPWVHFDNVPASLHLPFDAFPSDFDRLPTLSFVVPNLCNSMHDCSVSVGDNWARTHLSAYLDWAMTHDSLLVVTFDENDNRPGNQILTMVAGARVRTGQYSVPMDHYRLLATIEYMFGLPAIEQARRVEPITYLRQ